MPSRSVEAATRNEAIAAAREEFGPTARVVGVRRIRTGGTFGFFAKERYIAEVEVGTVAEPAAVPDAGGAAPKVARPAAGPSLDDRMTELADLLAAAADESPSVGLYGRSGASAAAAPTRATTRPGAGSATRSATPAAEPSTGPSARPSPLRSGADLKATPRSTPRSSAAAAPRRGAAKPFTPAKHTLMLPPEDLAPERPGPAEPVADRRTGPSPFAAALTRMVSSNPVQAAADAAAEQAAAEAAEAHAAAVQAAAVEATAAEAARLAAARIEAAAAEAARLRAEAAAAEAARREAQRQEAEAAAARLEAARLEAEQLEAEQLEAEQLEAEAARIEAEHAEAARIEAARLEAERREAERIEAERMEAARIEAERQEAERLQAVAVAAAAEAAAVRVQAAPAPSMVESVRNADAELAALLGEVLAANGSGGGRHRLPEELAEVLDVPQPWAYDTRATDSNAYDTGAYRTDAHAGGWASDARVAQRAAQVAAAQNLVVDAVVIEESRAEEARPEEVRCVEPRPVEAAVPVSLSPTMGRTASDPAPLSMDATMILPPLSLMPPQLFGSTGSMPPLLSSRPGVPPVRRGRPPVPAGRLHVATRPVPIPVPIAARPAAEALPAAEATGTKLATVTRLVPGMSSSSKALAPFSMTGPEELVVQLLTLGLPDELLGPDFTTDAANRGVYAALTRTLAERLPVAPRLTAEPGDVVMVVGPGAETFAAARALALSLRLEPEDVQWAAAGALAALAPECSRITSLETALERRRTSATTGTVTVVAVDAPLRTSGGPWLEHMLSVWSPTAVWAVLDSTRKPEDLVPWLNGLPRLDAVIVQDTESTADPAAVLSHVSVPVALVDGVRATAHRWASLLCERLEEMEA